MKKLLTFLTLLTLFTLTAGAETKTITLSWEGNDGSESTTALSTNEVLASEGKYNGDANVATCNTATKLYVAKNNYGLKVGAASNAGELDVSITQSVKPTRVVFRVAAYSTNTNKKSTVKAKLNSGNEQILIENSNNIDLTDIELTMDGNTVLSSINISSNRYAHLKSITIYYEEGDTPQPTTYTLTGTGDNGSIAFTVNNVAATSAEADATVTATATANTGYKFASWTEPSNVTNWSANGNVATFTMPASAVTVKATFEKIETALYERVTSISANDIGKKFIIVCEDSKTALSGIRSQESITITTHSTELPDGTPVNIYTLGGEDGAYTFLSDGKYMANTGTNNQTSLNHLAEPEEDDMAQWDVSFGNQYNAIIQCLHMFDNENGRYLRAYGTNDFRCYTTQSNGKDIFLYKEVTEVVEAGDLYIVGQVNGDGSEPMSTSNGVKLTYNQTSDTYSGDFYCIGVSNTSGYSNFLFSKKLPFSFSNTSDLYGAGADGSYWPISENGQNESHFGDAIPLFAKSTDNFRIPAGLYTVTVKLSGATGDNPKFDYTDKSIVVTKRDVTMAINSTGSNYFDDTKEVTMTSNLTELGGKIYYTTNGGNPSDPYSGRIEYTAPITIDATTTFKAVAYVGNLYSPIAEKTFTKTPKAPVITPNGGHIHEATQVTITCETEGASIYYTLDESTPTNVVSETNFLYSEPFTISKTTTVKARAYVGDTYSSITTAKFTYSEPIIPGTGDFQLVTKASQLVAGNELIIVTTFEGLDDELETVTYNYAMGAINSSNKGSHTTDFTFQGVIGTANSAITAGSGVNILKLGGSDGAFTLQQESDEKFLSMTKSNTNISASYSGSPLLITVDDSDYRAYVGNNAAENDRQILYSIENNNNVFGNYKSSNIGNNYKEIYLYYREAPATPKTLAEIVALGAAADGKKYCINEDLLGVKKSADGKTIWFKDDNKFANPDVCNSSDNNYEIDLGGGDIWYSKDATFDQSNWIEVVFPSEANYDGNYVKNLTGTYSYNGGNPKLTITKAVKDPEDVAIASPYTPNRYCIANFKGTQAGHYTNNGTVVTCNYFFVTPKPQEYAEIIDAVYSNNSLSMPSNSKGVSGTVSVDLSKNGSYEPKNNKVYSNFDVIICIDAPAAQGAPMLKAQGDNYKVYPVNLTADNDVPTAISTVAVSGDVKSVKYVNVAGVVSDRPFHGVNIVVTEYTDGSRTTAKMVR